jgi:hypothetical protein
MPYYVARIEKLENRYAAGSGSANPLESSLQWMQMFWMIRFYCHRLHQSNLRLGGDGTF